MGGLLSKYPVLQWSSTSTQQTSPLPDLKSKSGSVARSAASAAQFCRLEQKLIRNSWAANDDKELFGETIFMRIFEAQPNMKALFNWTDIPANQLHRNKRFRVHAINIVNVIDYCVQNIDSLSVKAAPKLRRLGRSHIRFQGFGFTASHWEIFRISIMTSLIHEYEHTSEGATVRVWEKLITWIIRQMQEGFNAVRDRLADEQVDFRATLKIAQESETQTWTTDISNGASEWVKAKESDGASWKSLAS